MEKYRLYTCSLCSACSTSKHIMEEHGEVYHKGELFNIEETTGVYSSPTAKPVSASKLQQTMSPPLQSKEKPAESKTSIMLNRRKRPMPSDTRVKSTPSGHPLPVDEGLGADGNSRSLPGFNSFYNLLNFFMQQREKALSDGTSSSSVDLPQTSSVSFPPLPAGPPTKPCPFCDKNLSNDLYELARHLAVVHLIPSPDLLSYMSGAAGGMQLNKEGENGAGFKGGRTEIPSSTSLPSLKVDSIASDLEQYSSAGMLGQDGANKLSAPPSSMFLMGAFPHESHSTNKPHASCNDAKITDSLHSESIESTNRRQLPATDQLFCPHCGGVFTTVQSLQLHLIQMHSNNLNGMLNLSQAMLAGHLQQHTKSSVNSANLLMTGPHVSGRSHLFDGRESIPILVTSNPTGMPSSSSMAGHQPEVGFARSTSPARGRSQWSAGTAVFSGDESGNPQTGFDPEMIASCAPPFTNMSLVTALATAAALGFPLDRFQSSQLKLPGGEEPPILSPTQEFEQRGGSERKRARLREHQTSFPTRPNHNMSNAINGMTGDQSISSGSNYWFGSGAVVGADGSTVTTTDNGRQAVHATGRDAPIPSSHCSSQPFTNYNPLLPGVDSLNLFPPLFGSIQRTDNFNMLPSLISSIQRSTKYANVFCGTESFTEPQDAPNVFHKHGDNCNFTNGCKDKDQMASPALLPPSFQQLLQPPPVIHPLSLLSTGWSGGIGGYFDKAVVSQNRRSGGEQLMNSEDTSRPSGSQPVDRMHTPHPVTTSASAIASIPTAVSAAPHSELMSRSCPTILTDSEPSTVKQATPSRSELRNAETPESQANQMNGLVHNTLRKTRSDMKVIHRYLIQVKHDNREIHSIPYYELDEYIQDFVLTAKKKDGHEYEPESLKAFVHSLERHLKQHGYPHSVLKGSGFAGTRTVLNQRLNELRALSRASGSSGNASGSMSLAGYYGDTGSNGGGGKRIGNQERGGLAKRFTAPGDPGSTVTGATPGSLIGRSFTPAALVHNGLLGIDNPQAILNSLWLINRTQFNIGGTQRHRNLVWGQFQLVTDEMTNKVIEFKPLFESAEVRYCRGFGGSLVGGTKASDPAHQQSQPLSCTGSAKRQPLPFNCVELLELYASLRPQEARGFSEPFYLAPDMNWEQTGNWFKTSAAGSQQLSRVPRLLGLKPSREPVQSQSISGERHKVDTTEALSVSKSNTQRITGFEKPQESHGGHNVFGQHQTEALNYTTSGESNAQTNMTNSQTVNFQLSPPCPPLGPASLFNFFPFMCPPLCESIQNKHPIFPLGGFLNPTFSNPHYRLGLPCRSNSFKEEKFNSSCTSGDSAEVKPVHPACHPQKFSGSSSTLSPDHTALLSPPLPQTHHNYNLPVSPMHLESLAPLEGSQHKGCSSDKISTTSSNKHRSEMVTSTQECVEPKERHSQPSELSSREARNLSPSSSCSPSMPSHASAAVSKAPDDSENITPSCVITASNSDEVKSDDCRTIRTDHSTAYAKNSSPLGEESISIGHAYIDGADSKDTSDMIRTSAWVDEAMNLTRCKQEESGIVV